VTVLFSDIRGFTTLSERHSPEAMFAMLNAWFEAIETQIRVQGGEVQKFIGDAVYVVFPRSGATGARGAVRAAAAMMRFLETFNAERIRADTFPIAIGIGIHTGPVLLGRVGSRERGEYAYIGETVNQAAALEATSKHGCFTRIVLSERTVELAGVTDLAVPLVLPSPDPRGTRAGDSGGLPPELSGVPLFELRHLPTEDADRG